MIVLSCDWCPKSFGYGMTGVFAQWPAMSDDGDSICVLPEELTALGGLCGVFVADGVPQPHEVGKGIAGNQYTAMGMPQQRNMPGGMPGRMNDFDVVVESRSVRGSGYDQRWWVGTSTHVLTVKARLEDAEWWGEL